MLRRRELWSVESVATHTVELTPIPLDKPCYYVSIPKGRPGMIEQLREQWKVMVEHSEVKPMLVAMPDDLALHEMPLRVLRKRVAEIQEILAQREIEENEVPVV